MIPIILDTDPGVDDALALFYALSNPELSILGLTTVFGNVPVKTATRNALWLLKHSGHSDIPVASGAERPLNGKTPKYAAMVHGTEGFGAYHAARSKRLPITNDAVDFLISKSHEYPGELVVIALGPLTNIAQAVIRDPEFPARLKSLMIMGGAFEVPGNVTAFAEANIYSDPMAAREVVAKFPNTVFIGLDVTDRIPLDSSDCNFLAAANSRWKPFIEQATGFYLNFHEQQRNMEGASLHDPTTIIALTRPDLFRFTSQVIAVEIDGEQVGRTSIIGDRNLTQVARHADIQAVRCEFLDSVEQWLAEQKT